VEPHYLTPEVMIGMFKLVAEHQSNIRKDVIFRGVRW
jgi:UDP-sulfoquinovose synthase